MSTRRLAFLSVLSLVAGCGGDDEAPLSAIGLSGITQSYDVSEESWRRLLDRAEEAGVDMLHVQTPGWADAETAPGEYSLAEFDPFFAMRGEYDFEYTLDIATPLGLSAPSVPADLTFESFGDPELEARYHAYVRHVLEQFEGTRHVVLHTETVGPYFDNDIDAPELVAYCDLVNGTARYIRSLDPEVSVAVYGTANESPEVLDCLTRDMDFFGISTILDRGDEPFEEAERLVAMAGDRPMAIMEAGIPTSSRVGGSEAGQVEYVEKLFALRERLGEQLLFVSYYQVFDEEEAVTRAYAPTLLPGLPEDDLEDFIAWIGSLGLHREDRTPKPAWTTFVDHVAAP